MHIPDGVVDPKTAVTTALLSAVALIAAGKSTRNATQARSIPLMGLAGAFVFAAQMVNFPVGPGTSGHLMGGSLVALLLGPGKAIITLTAVLVVQSLLFADGGVLALGVNILNIAVIAPLVASMAIRPLRLVLPGTRGLIASAACAGWLSTVAAATFCAGELAWSGTVPWYLVFPAMVNIHMLIGIGEGLITALIVAAVVRTRPELVEGQIDNRGISGLASRPGRVIAPLAYAAVLVIATLIFVAPFASPLPDGLERVAADLGFDMHDLPASAGVMADYRFPGIDSPLLSVALAGASGTIIVFGLFYLFSGRLLRKAGER